mmetsp:Transcript_12887/g.19597  ORF Transcript_12887/g.19597 Transcript_12887/m.19597 type:complete len:102 (-) Transcript_12887:1581-1886(-)
MPDDTLQENNIPENAGPAAFEILPPSMAKPFSDALCHGGTVRFVVIVTVAKTTVVNARIVEYRPPKYSSANTVICPETTPRLNINESGMKTTIGALQTVPI